MAGAGPDDMERRIDQWAAQMQEKAERYQQLKQDLTTISATASSANGAVTVTVGPSGVLQRLDLSDDIRTMRGSHLSTEIMAAIRKAQSTLGAQVTELMQERVGEDTTSIETVAKNYATQFPAETDDPAHDNTPAPDAGGDDAYFTDQPWGLRTDDRHR